MPTEKEVNYTPEMEAILKAAVPFNHAKAIELGKELGKKPSSIVAKINRMANEAGEGGEWYIPKPAYVPKTGEKPETKAELVARLVVVLDTGADLTGLAKADKATLNRLFAAVEAVVEVDSVESE